jgi:hypothetical protein
VTIQVRMIFSLIFSREGREINDYAYFGNPSARSIGPAPYGNRGPAPDGNRGHAPDDNRGLALDLIKKKRIYII